MTNYVCMYICSVYNLISTLKISYRQSQLYSTAVAIKCCTISNNLFFFILFLIPLFICQIMRVGILYDINRKIMKTKKKKRKTKNTYWTYKIFVHIHKIVNKMYHILVFVFWVWGNKTEKYMILKFRTCSVQKYNVFYWLNSVIIVPLTNS